MFFVGFVSIFVKTRALGFGFVIPIMSLDPIFIPAFFSGMDGRRVLPDRFSSPPGHPPPPQDGTAIHPSYNTRAEEFALVTAALQCGLYPARAPGDIPSVCVGTETVLSQRPSVKTPKRFQCWCRG